MAIGPIQVSTEFTAVPVRKSPLLITSGDQGHATLSPETSIQDGFHKTAEQPDPLKILPASEQPPRPEKIENKPSSHLDQALPSLQQQPMVPLLAETTIATNANGTLSIIDSSPAPGLHQTDPGEINFAKLYGVDTTSSSTIPHHFTQKEVEDHYLTGGPHKTHGLTEEGLKLYQTIKRHYLEGVPRCPHGSPSLYLTGGLPGSGKGYILGRVMKDRPEFVKVDPDEIKKLIVRDLASKNPALQGEMVGEQNWGSMVHETSSVLAKKLMDEALMTGKDIVFDSSMATKNVGKYREYAQRARRNGYKVYGIISDVSELTANERARKRADIPTKVVLNAGGVMELPGRLTSSTYIHDCAQNLNENLNTYLGESLFDQCIVYDNDAPVPVPKSIHRRVRMPDGTFTTVDELPKSSTSEQV